MRRIADARARTFRTLRHRNSRMYFAGHVVSITGTWMQRVGQDWLVLELTGRPAAVGYSTAFQFLPMLLFGLFGGVLVDRLNIRRLLVVTQAVSGVLAAVLAALTLTRSITVAAVYVLAFALGVVTVFDAPARQVFIASLVDPEDYVNTQALNSAVQNVGRLVGPAVAGILIASAGTGFTFVLNSVSFGGVLVALLMIDTTELRPAVRAPRARGQVREGLRYVWHHRELRIGIFVIAVVGTFGQNFRVVLSAFAKDTLGQGAEVYGWLTAAVGVGAVLGAIAAASRATAGGRSLLLWTLAFGVVNLGAAAVPSLGAALVAMVAIGITNITLNTLGRTFLQLRTEPGIQGRVMALYAVVFLGSTPIGGPLLGYVCELWGARGGFLVAGGTAILASAPFLGSFTRTADRLPAAAPGSGSAGHGRRTDPWPGSGHAAGRAGPGTGRP